MNEQELLALADDELIIGWRDSEWTGIAPLLEEDVAFSSIAQNEIGHARALYELAARDLGTTADELAFDFHEGRDRLEAGLLGGPADGLRHFRGMDLDGFTGLRIHEHDLHGVHVGLAVGDHVGVLRGQAVNEAGIP